MAQAKHQAVADSPTEIWHQYPGLSDSKLFHEYLTRLLAGRDMHVIVTASAETGVGKTTLAFALALLWDQHGWTTEKATLSPREYDVLYDEVPPGSVLLLDEVEQAADRRRASSSDNVNLSQAFAGKRYRQVFGIMTAPSKQWVDDRIGGESADYWIEALETDTGEPKGEARVYRLKTDDHYETSYEKKTETLSWPPMDWHPEWQALHQLKVDRFESAGEENYIAREKFERLKENYWNKASKKSRYHFIHALREFGLSQTDISQITQLAEDHSDGDLDGISQPAVSRQLDTESFEEYWS